MSWADNWIAIYAQDESGLKTGPYVIELQNGEQIFLPILSRAKSFVSTETHQLTGRIIITFINRELCHQIFRVIAIVSHCNQGFLVIFFLRGDPCSVVGEEVDAGWCTPVLATYVYPVKTLNGYKHGQKSRQINHSWAQEWFSETSN